MFSLCLPAVLLSVCPHARLPAFRPSVFAPLQVIQPVFNLMAEQICLMGDMGESPALRLGFDDFNESACMPTVGVQLWSFRLCAVSSRLYVAVLDGLGLSDIANWWAVLVAK